MGKIDVMGQHKGHNHNHGIVKGKSLTISILLNLAITVAQVAGGIISGSMALISDALHNFSDVVALAISWIARNLSSRKSTLKHTFGLKRTEIVAAFINSATLVGIALYLGYEAVSRIINPVEIKAGYVIWLAVASIGVNGISAFLLHKESSDSINIKSAYLHLLTDMLTSVAVLIGGLVIKYWGLNGIDGIITLLISVYLIYSSWHLLITSLDIILLSSPKDIDMELLVKEIEQINGVKNIHHLHLWKLTDNHTNLEAHIDLEDNISVSEFENKLKIIESIAKSFGIEHVTIQPEFSNNDDKSLIHNK